jgi:hypothetical protein|tara:strand:- start:1288 stop:1446 length:159 start_codon:yes stop_codon:yes gene_type:complete
MPYIEKIGQRVFQKLMTLFQEGRTNGTLFNTSTATATLFDLMLTGILSQPQK